MDTTENYTARSFTLRPHHSTLSATEERRKPSAHGAFGHNPPEQGAEPLGSSGNPSGGVLLLLQAWGALVPSTCTTKKQTKDGSSCGEVPATGTLKLKFPQASTLFWSPPKT